MKFGLFGGAVAARPSPGLDRAAPASRAAPRKSEDSHPFDDLIDTVVDAEALGFASVFLVEHHFTGSAQISASLNLLSFMAARTRRIRLGTAVLVLPWHNPVLLAEQVATVDVLSAGRLDLGVGKGYRPSEFSHFCIPADEVDDRYEECLYLLRKSLCSDQRFSYRSERWQFDDIVVEPAPVQRPHPPIWVAAGRPASLRAAAASDHCLLLDQFATFDTALERMAIYRDAVAAAGRDFVPESVALARGIALVDDGAGRERALRERMAQLAKMNRLAAGEDGRNVSSMVSDPDVLRAAEEGTLIGRPEEVVERIERLRDGGIDYILLAGLLGDRNQFRRFADEVMPRL